MDLVYNSYTQLAMQPTSAPPISNVKVHSLHIAEQINTSNQKAIMRMDDGLTMYKVSTINY